LGFEQYVLKIGRCERKKIELTRGVRGAEYRIDFGTRYVGVNYVKVNFATDEVKSRKEIYLVIRKKLVAKSSFAKISCN
jgi:hypothetical protein